MANQEIESIHNKFKESVTKAFSETAISFCNFVSNLFPKCGKTREVMLSMQVLPSMPKMSRNFIENWEVEMVKDVPLRVSYNKAFRRITGQNATYYDVCAYNDADVLFSHLGLKQYLDMDLLEKYKSETMTSEQKKICWNFITHLNLYATIFSGVERRKPPSRQEIHDNIQQHTKKDSEQSSTSTVVQIVQEVLREVRSKINLDSAEKIDTAGQTAAIDAHLTMLAENVSSETFCQSYNEQWSKFVARTVETASNSKISVKNGLSQNKFKPEDFDQFEDIDFFRAVKVSETFSNLKTNVSEQAANDFFNTIVSGTAQIATFLSVAKNVPANLMRTIEESAKNMNGTDMQGVDFMKLGQDVISNSSPQDLQNLASNIGSLLPDLQNMASTMQANGGMPDMSSLMQQMGGMMSN